MAFGMEVNPRKLRSLHMFCLVSTASLVRAETLPESEECSLRCEMEAEHNGIQDKICCHKMLRLDGGQSL